MIPPHTLIELSCKLTHCTPHDIIYSNGRTGTNARYLAYYLLREHAGMTRFNIARLIDRKSDSVKQSIRYVDKALAERDKTPRQQEVWKMILSADTYFKSD